MSDNSKSECLKLAKFVFSTFAGRAYVEKDLSSISSIYFAITTKQPEYIAGT